MGHGDSIRCMNATYRLDLDHYEIDADRIR
jgi:hypothetical protein